MPVCFHQAHLSTANFQLPVLSNLATVSLFHLKLSKIYEFWYIGESLPRCCLQNLNGLSIINASSWIKIARKFDLFVCQPVNLPSFLPSFFPPFLDASSHLYKWVCPSVRPSDRPSVRGSVTHVEKPLRDASNGQYWLLFFNPWQCTHTKLVLFFLYRT